jgi:thiosulfate/3-mercaptopyruvate sulfurtransferase
MASDNGYANPNVLVTTDWALEHKKDSTLRFVEVDVDTGEYEKGHIEGAIGWNWKTQLQDQTRRDILSKEQIEKFLGESGVTPQTGLILYGDNNNWFAAYAFLLLKYYGHEDVRLINGGRKKWVAEGKPLTLDVPRYEKASYEVGEVHNELRAHREFVYARLDDPSHGLVDVRSVDEYTGKVLASPGIPELSLREGHIPRAKKISWSQTVNEDGTFKTAQDLKLLYESNGIQPGLHEITAYCRIGERSPHTWFVLKYLLGYPKVRNYDGSWTEWGNLINAPIEK